MERTLIFPRLSNEVRQTYDVHQNKTWILLACMCYHYHDVIKLCAGVVAREERKEKTCTNYSKSDLANISLFCHSEERCEKEEGGMIISILQ